MNTPSLLSIVPEKGAFIDFEIKRICCYTSESIVREDTFFNHLAEFTMLSNTEYSTISVFTDSTMFVMVEECLFITVLSPFVESLLLQ